MVEMSDTEYHGSSLLDLVWFVLRVPFARALRQRTVAAWILSLPIAAVYLAFAVPLVVGSVLVLLTLMVPMLVIALVSRLLDVALFGTSGRGEAAIGELRPHDGDRVEEIADVAEGVGAPLIPHEP